MSKKQYIFNSPCKNELIEDCSCERPKGVILCRICGYQMFGRLKLSCPQHPKTIFLMDIEWCPRCKAFGKMLIQFQKSATTVSGINFEKGLV